jgi:hypothetical protein
VRVSGGITPPFLILSLDGSEWLASCHCCFTTGEDIVPSAHCIGGWLGPRVGRDTTEKRKNLAHAGNQTLVP